MKEIVPIELNTESFKNYGCVINKMELKPNVYNEEFKYWSKTSQFSINGVTSTGMLCPSKREMLVKCFERHINTVEVLVALEGDSIICVGKQSATDDENIEGIQAFYIKQGDAFLINKGIWHWIPYPINSTGSKFIVMFSLGTEDNDLMIKHLTNEINITM